MYFELTSLQRLKLANNLITEIPSEIEKLTPFPEVPEALQRLAKSYKLVILSNGDRDMLDAAKPYLGHTFDATVSVQEAGYFKPHRKTYEKTAEILDLSVIQCMHVANHAFDCVGAKAAGIAASQAPQRDTGKVSYRNPKATR